MKYYDRQGNEIDRSEWFTFFEGDGWRDRRVAKNRVTDPKRRKHLISTVFLVIDHSFGEGPPILFESMVFCRDHDCGWGNWCERYHNEDEAKEGHRRLMHLVRSFSDPDEIEGYGS